MSIFETAQRQCLQKSGNLIKRKVIGEVFCLLHFICANQISSQPVEPVRVSCVLVKLADSQKF